MPLFEVEATKVEPVFQKLYSYIFDMENLASSAEEMDRPVPNSIFIVNFDQVWSALCSVYGLFLPSLLLIFDYCNSVLFSSLTKFSSYP